MKNFGKFTEHPETIEVPGDQIGTDADGEAIFGPSQFYRVVIYRDKSGQDMVVVGKAHPHAYFIACQDDGTIISMTDDIEQSQIAGFDIIGIDSDYGFTSGPGGTVYGMKWNGKAIVDPATLMTIAERRAAMPRKSSVEFRATLRGIRTDSVPEGIYADDILSRIAMIADRDLQEEALDYFERGSYFERANPWIDILGSMFGLTPEDIDTIWMN